MYLKIRTIQDRIRNISPKRLQGQSSKNRSTKPKSKGISFESRGGRR